MKYSAPASSVRSSGSSISNTSSNSVVGAALEGLADWCFAYQVHVSVHVCVGSVSPTEWGKGERKGELINMQLRSKHPVTTSKDIHVT